MRGQRARYGPRGGDLLGRAVAPAPPPRLRELIAAWRLLGAERPELVLLSTRGLPLWALPARLRGIVPVSHLHQVPLRPLRWRERLRPTPYRFCARVLVNDEASRRALRRASSSLVTRAEVLRTGSAPSLLQRSGIPRQLTVVRGAAAGAEGHERRLRRRADASASR